MASHDMRAKFFDDCFRAAFSSVEKCTNTERRQNHRRLKTAEKRKEQELEQRIMDQVVWLIPCLYSFAFFHSFRKYPPFQLAVTVYPLPSPHQTSHPAHSALRLLCILTTHRRPALAQKLSSAGVRMLLDVHASKYLERWNGTRVSEGC